MVEIFKEKKNINNRENEDNPKIEILLKDWQILELITRRASGDFGIVVKLGEPGEGSFIDHKDGSIIFDPL